MNIFRLECFLHAAQTGKFSLAAEELYTTQSTVTKQIQALEKEMGVLLFDRNSRTASLTVAGQILLAGLPSILEGYHTLIEEVRNHQSPVCIGIIPIMAHYAFANDLTVFRHKFPNISIVYEEESNWALPQKLKDKVYEMIIYRKMPNEKNDLDCISLAHDELVLAVSAGHPFAGQQKRSLRDFEKDSFVLLDKKTGLFNISMAACKNAGFSPYIYYVGSSSKNIIDIVSCGNAVALLMKQVAVNIADKSVSILSIEETVQSTVVLSKNKNKKLSPNAQLFWNYMQQKACENDFSGHE